MLLTDVQIAARNLTRHTRRNLFLGGALATVTALLVLLGALTAGMEASMMESTLTRITSYNVCYTKLLRVDQGELRRTVELSLDELMPADPDSASVEIPDARALPDSALERQRAREAVREAT